MPSDVETPDPPQLTNRGVPVEFELVELTGGAAALRREELETALGDGAWQEAFEEWSEYTDLTAAQIRLLDDRGLFQAFDFYWNPEDALLDFAPPAVPDDLPADVESGSLDASTVRTELRDLGRAVVEMLEADSLDWGEEDETEYNWGDEAFGESPDAEE